METTLIIINTLAIILMIVGMVAGEENKVGTIEITLFTMFLILNLVFLLSH